MSHLDDATWERLASGELGAGARTAAFDHIVACGECARIWKGLERLREDAEADGLIAPQMPVARRVWMRSPIVGLAIAASLILAVAAVVTRNVRETAVPPTTIPATAPAAPSVPSAEVGSASFPLSKAVIHALPQDAFEPRGSTSSSEPSVQRLADALAPYRRDDFKEAVRLLGALWSEYPRSARPALYLGVSLLFDDRPSDALAPLLAATNAPQSVIADEARWYHAVALARAGRIAEARDEAARLCATGGDSAARACAASGK